MIKVLNTKSKDFKKKINYYLNIRRKYSNNKITTVKKSLMMSEKIKINQ